jgi:predicted RNA-binding Zn-ribbon protein involved in translation (DUF1610 family)
VIEPHANVWRTECPACGEAEFFVITVPKLSTGREKPVSGVCEACGHEADLGHRSLFDPRFEKVPTR